MGTPDAALDCQWPGTFEPFPISMRPNPAAVRVRVYTSGRVRQGNVALYHGEGAGRPSAASRPLDRHDISGMTFPLAKPVGRQLHQERAAPKHHEHRTGY